MVHRSGSHIISASTPPSAGSHPSWKFRSSIMPGTGRMQSRGIRNVSITGWVRTPIRTRLGTASLPNSSSRRSATILPLTRHQWPWPEVPWHGRIRLLQMARSFVCLRGRPRISHRFPCPVIHCATAIPLSVSESGRKSPWPEIGLFRFVMESFIF